MKHKEISIGISKRRISRARRRMLSIKMGTKLPKGAVIWAISRR
jgi:hypothetical protein